VIYFANVWRNPSPGTTCDPAALDSHKNPMPCVSSSSKGKFPKLTTEPEQFKNSGYLAMGVGKLFHDGGGGYGAGGDGVGTPDHPAGSVTHRTLSVTSASTPFVCFAQDLCKITLSPLVWWLKPKQHVAKSDRFE
jgi:hypothetical protein